MLLPSGRGPLSAAVLGVLGGRGELDSETLVDLARARAVVADPLTDEDVHLTLWVLYELHYLGFEDVDDEWEWHPDLLRVRRELESVFEHALRRRTQAQVVTALGADGGVAERLFELAEISEGPSLARYVQRHATSGQFAELMIHRSIYQLKEADPHTWAIPRITGRAKAALVELQYDEYGAGRPERVHATMFGDALEGCGLERDYGAYLDQVPGYTLAVSNAMSLLGLHRRLRASAMGHLAAVEATSSLPCRKYVGGIERLGLPHPVVAYFDEHVEADAVHEQVATRDICAELASQDPARVPDIFFGAAVCLLMDRVVAERMLEAWESGRSALRRDGVESVAS